MRGAPTPAPRECWIGRVSLYGKAVKEDLTCVLSEKCVEYQNNL